MIRLASFACCSLLLASPGLAQTPSPSPPGDLHRAPAQVRHAGTYQVATATWRRGAPVQNLGGAASPDVIYNNTSPSGYFSAGGAGQFGNELFIADEGGVPTLDDPTPFSVGPDRVAYLVDGFEIGYCDFLTPDPGASAWRVSFYDEYAGLCAEPSDLEPVPGGVLELTGLPTGGCWTMVIDLTGIEFTLRGDGGDLDPGFNGDPDLDSFTWTHQYIGAGGPNQGQAGFLLAGDPDSNEAGYAGTNPNPGAGAIAPPPTAGTSTYYEPAPGLCPTTTTTLAPFSSDGRLTRDVFYLGDMLPARRRGRAASSSVGTSTPTGAGPRARTPSPRSTW